MDKVTIEEINGKQCTVIRKCLTKKIIKESFVYGFDNGFDIRLTYSDWPKGYSEPLSNFSSDDFEDDIEGWSILTILPPLPKHPTPEDASLIYRYMSEGFRVYINDFAEDGHQHELIGLELGEGYCTSHNWGVTKVQITHATLNGECVEIAILEKDNG